MSGAGATEGCPSPAFWWPKFDRFHCDIDEAGCQEPACYTQDDIVVVECRGEVQKLRGEAYNNTYCHVCRFGEAGQMRELAESMDMALCEPVVVPPVFAASA